MSTSLLGEARPPLEGRDGGRERSTFKLGLKLFLETHAFEYQDACTRLFVVDYF